MKVWLRPGRLECRYRLGLRSHSVAHECQQCVRTARVRVVVVDGRHSLLHCFLNDLQERSAAVDRHCRLADRPHPAADEDRTLLRLTDAEVRLVAVPVWLVAEVSDPLVVHLDERRADTVLDPLVLERRKATEELAHNLRDDPVELVRILATLRAEQREGLPGAGLAVGEEARLLPIQQRVDHGDATRDVCLSAHALHGCRRRSAL
eukprot:6032635-Prymnesium_polylepis.1